MTPLPWTATTRPLSTRAPSVRSLLTQFAVVAFLVVGTGLVLGKLAVDAMIRRVEGEEVLDDLTRARLAFQRLASRAQQRAEDYAFWDETVQLAQGAGTGGVSAFDRHFYESWLPRSDYEFIELFDARGAQVFTLTSSPAARAPAEARTAAIVAALAQGPSVGGYLRDGNDLYLIAGSAVHPGPRSPARSAEDARGYLVIGRSMRGTALKALELDLNFGIRMLPGDTPLPNTPQRAEAFAGSDSVRVFFPLTGVTGQREAVVELRDGRTELHRISLWALYGSAGGLLFGALAFFFVWLYGRRLLITPLRFIASEIEAMHGRGELAEVTSAPPSEEWALFLATFNETVRSLRESEQRYGALFDRAVDPYFLIDAPSGVVVDANPAATALVGEPRDRLVGAPLPAMLRAPESGSAIRVRRPDGTVQTWGVVETLVILGERRLVLAAYRDLTDREALAQSQKMDAVGSLAGGIAHDFNNLMGSVLAGVRVARGTITPDDRRGASALDAIEHAGRRAADLTRQLLGVTRHEPLVRVPVDVGGAIANIERMCASTFDRRIRIVVDVQPRLPAVLGDPGQVEQALLNLCINARDAMPGGGMLRLAARAERLDDAAALTIRDIQPGPYVVLSVSDDGAGMSDDIKQRIFEPFFTTKASGKGTGLGLAMVYGFVRSSEGTIVVDSAPDAGSRFDLYLPASTTDAVVPAVAPESSLRTAPPRASRERPTVLLADDEAGLREMLRMVLEHEGYDVIEATNGNEAIAAVAERRGDIAAVLLDVQMPVLGGLDAYARIRTMLPDLPVMLGTGYVGPAELAAMRDAGADDLITKPYEMRDLLDRLARMTAARA